MLTHINPTTPLLLLSCSILQGRPPCGTLASSGDQHDAACDSTSSCRDSSSSGADRSGHETLFFAGSLYHTYKGEIISLTRSRPGTAFGSPGRYNPLVSVPGLANVRVPLHGMYSLQPVLHGQHCCNSEPQLVMQQTAAVMQHFSTEVVMYILRISQHFSRLTLPGS